MRFARFAILAAVLMYSGSAWAYFHNFGINEVYSNASGTVQFVELRERNGADFETVATLSGLTSGSGGDFDPFPSDLTNTDTSFRHILIASSGFTSIPGAPAPDYTLPDGFLNIAGDSVTLTGIDSIGFGALPGGIFSLNRSGGSMVQGVATPTNFAGNTSGVPEPGTGALVIAGMIALMRRRK